jgi:hypothetical protein
MSRKAIKYIVHGNVKVSKLFLYLSRCIDITQFHQRKLVVWMWFVRGWWWIHQRRLVVCWGWIREEWWCESGLFGGGGGGGIIREDWWCESGSFGGWILLPSLFSPCWIKSEIQHTLLNSKSN